MKSKVRSSFSWFLSILLVLTMMPAMAFTASALSDPVAPTAVWSITDENNYPSYNYEAGTGANQGGTLTATFEYETTETCTFTWYKSSTNTTNKDADGVSSVGTNEITGTGTGDVKTFECVKVVPAGLPVGDTYLFCTVKIGSETTEYPPEAATKVTVNSLGDAPEPTVATNGQPTSITSGLTYGSISDASLSFVVNEVTENATGCTFQWFYTDDESVAVGADTGWTALADAAELGATQAWTATYEIPENANAGTLYYYCKVTSSKEGYDDSVLNSNKATVTVAKKPVTLTAKDQIVVGSNGSIVDYPITDYVAATGLLEGDSLYSVTITKSSGNKIVVSDNAIIKHGDNPVTANYEITRCDGKWTLYSGEGGALEVTVKNSNAENVNTGKVYLEQGSLSYGSGDLSSANPQIFSNIEPGRYNVIVESGDHKVTTVHDFDPEDVDSMALTVSLPEVATNSVLDNDAAGSLAPVVVGLDDIASNLHNSNPAQIVTVTFTVTSEANLATMSADEQEAFTTGISEIEDALSAAHPSTSGTYTATFLDMSLWATVGAADPANIGSTNNTPLDVIVPYTTGVTGTSIEVWRFHGTTASKLDDLSDLATIATISTLPSDREGFIAEGDNVAIHASGYSVYAIVTVAAANNNNNNNGGGGGGGGGRTSGGIAATTPDTPATTEPTTTEPVVTNPTTGTSTTTFTDVKEGAYYAEAVKWAVAAGITNGKTATLFGPDDSCTRAQIVTFIWRAMGSPEPTVSTTAFTDIDANAYYYKAVLWAVEAGVANGTSATTFSPNATVTRGEAVTFLYRAKGGSLATTTSQFADVDPGAYYAEAVAWAAANGITTGTSATTFSPNEKCTRGQIVTFLYRVNN